jgi:DNA polymerase-3 subunit epsilon
MRQVILDTETTGLNPATGDRIIEIGCVEMVGRRLTDRTFHYYVNPERDIDAGAFAVHGLSREFLSDKPVFANIVEQLIEFVDGAEIVIHNAAFDLGFLDNEFALLKRPPFRNLASKVTDTLLEARQMFPGKRNSLDALCERFSISNQHRTLHGALLDAQLLAEVYVAMTRGQEDLSIDLIDYTVDTDSEGNTKSLPTTLKFIAASDDECRLHEKVLAEIATASKKDSVWSPIQTANSIV